MHSKNFNHTLFTIQKRFPIPNYPWIAVRILTVKLCNDLSTDGPNGQVEAEDP